MSEQKRETLLDLPILKEPFDNQWILFEDLISILKRNLLSSDGWKEVRNDNVLRFFKEKKGYQEFNGSRILKFHVLLRFIFAFYNTLDICERSAFIIENRLEGKRGEDKYASSILDLYNVVSKFSVKDSSIETLLVDVRISDDKIKTLYSDYKSMFDDLQWQRIKLFEYHFSKSHLYNPGSGYEDILEHKWRLFQEWKNVSSFAGSLTTHIKDTIKDNTKRQACSERHHGVLLTGDNNKKHIPALFEGLADSLPKEIKDELKYLVFADCHQTCTHKPGLHIFIEPYNGNLKEEFFRDVYVLISSLTEESHHEICHEVTFFAPGTLNDYVHEERPQRFLLRDDVIRGKFGKSLLSTFKSEKDSLSITASNECPTCSLPLENEEPLHWTSIDVLYEWLFNVPFTFQAILECFINGKSFKKSNNKDNYIQDKISRLYLIFHSLLNVYNRCYSGVLQDRNTDELSFTYHNVSSVFALTSQAGLTSSYHEAERRLKKEADPDVCYFNTYLKKHPILYATCEGMKQKEVNLQECYLVLFLDNLVRLTCQSNTGRGESRTSQVCTLPVSIKGIPKDCKNLESWHDESICDGSKTCKCREPKNLPKDAFSQVLLQLSPKESSSMSKFHTYITWSVADIWRSLTSQMSALISTAIESNLESALDECDVDGEDDAVVGLEEDESVEDQGDEELCSTDQNMSNIVNEDSDTIDESTDESDGLSDISNISDLLDENDIHKSMNFESEFQKLDDSFSAMNVYDSLEDASENNQVRGHDDTRQGNGSVQKSNLRMGFEVFVPPPMLSRHPPPFTGRDDDINKLTEILTDVLLRTGNHPDLQGELDSTRILFAPDQKIGQNLIKLASKQNSIFQKFLPEFPLLHLRKSKLRIFLSSYDSTGLKVLLKYMHDRDEDTWVKLIHADHIESGTRAIRRLAVALLLSFMVKFLEYLPEDSANELSNDLEMKEIHTLNTKWQESFDAFIGIRCSENATFTLHWEMFQHCEEILAISLAERVGGPEGYALLLSAVKRSLPFSFLNGASAYAAFCTELVYMHYSAGIFHQRMKESLFSTPYEGSDGNFALDTQREMEHRVALKGFRPRATVQSVIPRMSLVDKFQEMQKKSSRSDLSEDKKIKQHLQSVAWKLTRQDIEHIIPTAELILRRGGLDVINNSSIPRNMYLKDHPDLPDYVLDCKTLEVGKYLVRKFACRQGLFGLKTEDLPQAETISGPKQILSKAVKGKGVTIRRMSGKQTSAPSKKDKQEQQRKNRVKRETTFADCISSEMNTVQALLKPDCTKPHVNKSLTMKEAISYVTSLSFEADTHAETKSGKHAKETVKHMQSHLAKEGLIILHQKAIPTCIQETSTVAVVEFAGVKFKIFASSGLQYVKKVEDMVLRRICSQYPKVKHIVLSEEKYSFTPDDFKAATRSDRAKNTTKSGYQDMKKASEIISSSSYDKKGVTMTMQGKSSISIYLAANIADVSIREDITVDIDSEFITEGCICSLDTCLCEKKYTVPLQVKFNTSNGYAESYPLNAIKQRKGEAEMAQIDWLVEHQQLLSEKDSIVSIVTSGDIDAVPIHLFAISRVWPRKDDGTFKNAVFVVLQKPEGLHDIYNITAIISGLERKYGKGAAMKFAIVFCMGGNDFLLKYHRMTHLIIAETFAEKFFDSLFDCTFSPDDDIITSMKINRDTYANFIKHLYCPKMFDPDTLSLEEVRQLSVKDPRTKVYKPPTAWMPPTSALHRVASLVDLQIDYMFTAGIHDAVLPDFLSKDCLRRDEEGCTEYFLGDDVKVSQKEDLLTIPEEDLLQALTGGRRKRTQASTPQKGARRKRKPNTSTPNSKKTNIS